VIGGVAIERFESWLLALAGKTGSEKARRPEATLTELGVNTTAEMVELVESVGLDRIPEDAGSLRSWIERARAMLGQST